MKTNRLLPLVALLFASFCLVGCPPQGNGSQGADFDPSQYYTKAQIDAYLQNVLPAHVSGANLSATVTGSNTAYSSGASMGGSLPAHAIGALVRLQFSGTDLGNKTLYFGDSDSHADSFVYGLGSGEGCLVYVDFRPNNTAFTATPRWWSTLTSSTLTISDALLFFFDPASGQP